MAGNFALQDPDGKDHPIEGIVQIGRDRLNHVYLKDPMISRLHATAWVDGEKVLLQDEGSSNGTLVNGMPVRQPIALQVGDQVQMGQTTLILVDTRAGWIHEAPEPMPIQAPPPPPPQKRNIGFPLAMAVLGILAIVACAIIAVFVYGYVTFVRPGPPQPASENFAPPGISLAAPPDLIFVVNFLVPSQSDAPPGFRRNVEVFSMSHMTRTQSPALIVGGPDGKSNGMRRYPEHEMRDE